MTYIAKPRLHHPTLAKNQAGYTRRDYEGKISTLCAGCGHDSISAAIIQACWEMDVEPELAEACRRDLPPDALVLAPVLERHRAWVATMWGRPCPQAGYGGLGEMYLAHPDFRARFEAIEPGFTEYLAEAMKAHAARSAT